MDAPDRRPRPAIPLQYRAAAMPKAPTAGPPASFAIEELEVRDGRLIVSGRWSGVRGLRFMRPTLVVGDRPVLATLEHKPWAPSDDQPWTAAFPWEGDPPDVDDVALVVAPSVSVPLGDGGGAEPPVEAAGAADADSELRLARLETEVSYLREELERERASARREREQLAARVDEAVTDREAALRTRERMESQRDEAIAARDAVEAQRDEALAQRAELAAHLDEVLLANRTLQQQLAARAAANEAQADAREEHAGPAPTAPAKAPASPPDDDRPIGTRAIPAARVVGADLYRGLRARAGGASRYDLYALRALGAVAAICFILLLVMLLRVFL